MTLGSRRLLHKSKIEEFSKFLVSRGYKIQPTKDTWEVLRAKSDSDTLIVFTKMNAKEHYTVQGKDMQIVREFIRGEK